MASRIEQKETYLTDQFHGKAQAQATYMYV